MAERHEQCKALAIGTIHTIPETLISPRHNATHRLSPGMDNGGEEVQSEKERNFNCIDFFTNDQKLWTPQHQQPQRNRMWKHIHFSLTSKCRKINLPIVRLCILFIFVTNLYLVELMFQSPIEVPAQRQNISLQEQP